MGTEEIRIEPCTTAGCLRATDAPPAPVTGGGPAVAPQLPTPPPAVPPPPPVPFLGNADDFDFTTPPPAQGTAGVLADPLPVPAPLPAPIAATRPPAAAPTVPPIPVGTTFLDAIGFTDPGLAAPTRQPVGHDAIDDPTT